MHANALMIARRLVPPRWATRGALLLVGLAALGACSGRIGAQSPTTPGGGGGGGGGGGPGPSTCARPTPPVTPRLTRLSFAQYDASVRALTGLDLTPSAELGPEVDGVTPVFWAGVRAAAEDVARRAFDDPSARARLVRCTPSGDGAACARDTITQLGRRAYRRALTAAEQARYVALWDDRAALTETGSFDEAMEVVFAAMLQSPGFLLRAERSATRDADRIALEGVELASRLSYALWNAPPDEALLDAAERGDLDTREGVAAEAQRMLSTPEGVARARAMFRAATRDWLGMTGAYAQFWSNTQRDPALFPEFYAGIDADFRDEVLRFVDHVVFEQEGSFAALFTSRDAVVNDKLAPIYGVPAPPAGTWAPVTLDDTRPGLLTRAGFVGSHGRFGRGSLIFRGTFVLTRLMCQHLGSPPAGADATPLPDASANARTTRERVVAMTSAPACAACHATRINPAGFALERFDGIGRARTEDNGAPVDTTGALAIDGVTQSYADAPGYARLLADSSEVRACWVQRFADFTWSDRDVELGCAKAELAAKLADPSISVKDALVAMVSSDVFRFRAAQEAP